MKKLTYVALIVLLAMTASTVSAQITGTRHNLSTSGPMTDTSTDEDRICVFCHTPHQAATANSIQPLWNHTTNTTAAYGVYSSATFDETGYSDIADIATGGMNTSLLCMSCHDGTVAVNSLYNPSNEFGTPTMGSGTELNAGGQIVSAANLGTDLTDDHPVNFTYFLSANAPAEGAAKLHNTAAVSNGFLIAGMVLCASCHDAHGSAGHPALLRDDPSGSVLCLNCHNK